ncbi:hypothetical protein [Candidatus Francisella endociliophora]|uniref:hypothetical protein n=1 Tax=Candidatus Francisella endociliophora TaxID=653937 RepID=UPI000B2FF01E|nr:hypothetical protein [Francisella sp. FSC1006]
MKRLQKLIIIIYIVILSSCASDPKPKISQLGNGVVESEVETVSRDAIVNHSGAEGAKVGAAVGATGGAAYGAMAGTALGIGCTILTAGVGAVPCFAVFIGSGVIVGGTMGGVGGAIVGGGGNYIYVANQKNVIGKYRYHVSLDGRDKPLVFEELPDRKYPKGTDVVVYESDYKDTKTYFIKAVDENKDKSLSDKESTDNTKIKAQDIDQKK